MNLSKGMARLVYLMGKRSFQKPEKRDWQSTGQCGRKSCLVFGGKQPWPAAVGVFVSTLETQESMEQSSISLAYSYVSKTGPYSFIYRLKRSTFFFILCRIHTRRTAFLDSLRFVFFHDIARNTVVLFFHSVEKFKIQLRPWERAQICHWSCS